jgi:predicted ATPase
MVDNCGHLLDACDPGQHSPQGCPDLLLRATSRKALGVAGEVRMPVLPMPLLGEGDEELLKRHMNS